jgi:hypothetical protein
MSTRSDNKYELKDLYQEIDLFDRKIAYCQNFENFATDEERASARQKLVTKRGTLVKAALEMAGRGVECDPKYLPRSFQAPAEAAKVTP